MTRTLALLAATALTLGNVTAAAPTAQTQAPAPASALEPKALPSGAGLDVLQKRCLICHESDLITSQRLSLAGWTRSVDKMVRWGSQITADEREVLQPYLAAHFAPRPVVSHASVEAGEAVFKRACVSCHESDLVEQQRLTKTGWTRSVEKMMRWGARVPDADKEPLIDYLAARFPPR